MEFVEKAEDRHRTAGATGGASWHPARPMRLRYWHAADTGRADTFQTAAGAFSSALIDVYVNVR
jgi:hypothetical protein